MMVSVVIVTIAAKDYIQSCLNSLLQQTQPLFEIIIIDNSSKLKFSKGAIPDEIASLTAFARNDTPPFTDQLHKEIHKLYPSVKLYPSEENLFYAAALNKGIGLSKGEFILCLNDDVVLDKEFIREALKGFLIKNNIGSVSGKILRGDRKTLDSTGLFLSAWRTAKERGYGQPDLGQFEKAGFIFGVNGAVAFYRRQMLEDVKDINGYFDSRFGMFYEDLDISWRAKRRGWLAYYLPTALAYHARGGSFRPDAGIGKAIARKYLNDRLHCDLIKNRYLTILKNETFLGFLLHLVPILIYDLCAWSYVLIFCLRVVKLFFRRQRELHNKF